MSQLHAVAEAVAVIAACIGIAYYVFCLWAARSFLRDSRAPLSTFTPPISILKPVRGTDPEIYEAFRSHCLQDYADYEIVFGVSDPNDDAVPLVKRLEREFPDRSIRLVLCSEVCGTNVKVSNLIHMLREARHQYIVVNDSDIRVPTDYLRRVIAPLANPEVGMVTCMYRGQASDTIGSRVEAIGISTEFHAGVLAARTLEGGIHFALGSTLAFTRAALHAIGGLEPMVDYLADDYELGRRVSAAGFRVVLSDVIVDTHLPAYSFDAFFSHQLRWARSTRHARRWGYTGLVLTFAVPWALVAVGAAHRAPWSWALLAAAILTRYLVAFVVGRVVLRDRQAWRDWWLILVRDFIAPLIWIGSYTGRTVAWRGDQFILKDGKLRPA